MDSATQTLVEQIHDAGTRFVLAVTGGGSGAIASLFTVPGASRSMLLAAVPYADTALVEWLGSRPEKFCSARTARAMAMAAFQKAKTLNGSGAKLAGVGCTASLASDRPKHGPHRFHIAVQTVDATTCVSVELEKGRRSRAEEEQIVAISILNAMATACGLAAQLPTNLTPTETQSQAQATAPPEWQDLLAGQVARVCCQPAAQRNSQKSTDPPRVLFPGAFNPLHIGHREIAEIANRRLGSPTHFEISIVNVDKPPLDYLEIHHRTQQLQSLGPVWLTRAPTFAEKASLFPGVTFLVGTDTLSRIAEPRYYHHNFPKMFAAIEAIATAGCRFLVFGRQSDGTFRTLTDLNLPPSLIALCDEVPEAEFRIDVSSSDLRRQSGDSNADSPD